MPYSSACLPQMWFRDHFKKDCKVKKIYVECTGEDEDDDPPEVEGTDEDQDQSDDVDGIWDSDSSSVVLRTVRTSKSSSTSSYSCRFGKNCLQLVLDSGASQSITGSKQLLVDKKPMSSTLVINAFGGHSVASSKGTLKVMLTNNVELVVPNVLYCKEVDGNILSVVHLVREGLTVQVDKIGAHLFKQAGKIYSGTYQDGSYLVHATVTYQPKEAVQALATKVTPELTHAPIGHASVPYLKRAGLPAVASGFCMAFSAGKQTRRYVKKQTSFITSFKPTHPLSKIHVDTAGPYRRSIDGQRYFVTILDGFTRYLSVVVVKKKSAIASRLIVGLTKKKISYNKPYNASLLTKVQNS